jgi:hypothetical protein
VRGPQVGKVGELDILQHRDVAVGPLLSLVSIIIL